MEQGGLLYMNKVKSIQESIDYIELCLKEDINLEKLAQKAFLSKYHYHRLFHSIVGEPVMEYVRKRRLSEAANELKNTNEKLIDIAIKYQFSSEEAFIRSFKNVFGISPGQYRKDKKIIFLHSRMKAITVKNIDNVNISNDIKAINNLKDMITKKAYSTKMCIAA
jgi:AraC-like DNA-binding protein